jgi:hypothetical protein
MKEWITRTLGSFFSFLYPYLLEYPKKSESPNGGGPLPVPFSRIPGEAFDETGFENPKKRGFGEHGEISDHLERRFVLFLGENSN